MLNSRSVILRGIITVAVLLAITSGVVFAFAQFTRSLAASVNILVIPEDGIEVYLDAGLTEVATSIEFGTVVVDFFGSMGEPPSVPVWVKNHSLSTIELTLDDDYGMADVVFKGVSEKTVLEPGEVFAGELTLSFNEGAEGTFDFTIFFNADGPVEPIWIDRYLQGPGYKPEWGQPVVGGILRYGASHALNGHDPNYGHSFEGPQFLPTYNALLRFDAWVGVSGAIEGDLAETWDISGDGTVVTFKLRKGVKFQDNPNLPVAVTGVSGDEFTCEDAVASLDFALNPPEGINHTGPRAALTHFESASCPEGALGYTLVVNFKEPLSRTITMFAGGRGMPNNMDKDFIDWLVSECVQCLDDTTPTTYLYGTGTGAFIPTEFTADVISKVRRNPTYFRGGLPLLDGMDHFVMKDFNTRFAALVTGQIDYFGEGSASLLPGQVDQIQRNFSDKIVIQPVAHSWGKGLQINMNRPPFENVRVRKALHLALDRDDWADFNLAGTLPGVIQPTNWMPPGTIWALPDNELMSLPGWRRGQGKVDDIAEANRLLDEALGKDVRFSFLCMAQSSQIFIDGCLFLKDQLMKNVGVEVIMDIVDSPTESQRYNAENYDTHYGAKAVTNVGEPDDWYMLSLVPEFESSYYQATGAEVSEPAGLAAELEAMVRAQSKELDVVKRQQMVWEIERKLATEAFYFIPFPWTNIFPAWSMNLKGWTLGPFPSQVKWAQWERAWLGQ